MWQRQGDQSIYEHLLQAERATGKWQEALHPEPPPEVLAHVWDWFLELHLARVDGPITYPDIAEWSRLTGRAVEPWEVDLLKQMDGLYLRMRAKEARTT